MHVWYIMNNFINDYLTIEANARHHIEILYSPNVNRVYNLYDGIFLLNYANATLAVKHPMSKNYWN